MHCTNSPLLSPFSGLLLLLRCKEPDWLSLHLHFSKFESANHDWLAKMARPVVLTCRHADQGQLPTSVPHPERSLLQCCTVCLCRSAGKHNPIFKIHWCHCTCCHSQWKHFELHDAAMSQSLQPENYTSVRKVNCVWISWDFITPTTAMPTIEGGPCLILFF